MFQLTAILMLVQSILCQDILFSFDEKFKKTLNNQNCDNKHNWTLVEYGSIEISAYPEKTALRASKESCERIPICLVPGSVLKLVVFLKTVALNSGVVIEVYLEGSGLITKYAYNRADETFYEGWRELSLETKSCGAGYINLLGYSENNEMVLIDSVQYILNTTNIEVNTDKCCLIIDEENKEYKLEEIAKELTNNSRKKEPYSNDVEIKDLKQTSYNSRGLGPWAITLIVLGCVTIAALVGTSAYHIGKIKSRSKCPPSPNIIDEEPPIVEIIPRVRGTVHQFENPHQHYI